MTARQLLLLLLLLLLSPALLAARAKWLDPAQTDWLVQPVRAQAAFNKIGENLWRLSNGLIHRDFIVSPNFATVDFYSTEADTSLLRAFSPEATVRLLTESGPRSVPVGGVRSDGGRAYLNRSAPVRPLTGPVFRYASHTTTPVSSDIRYTPARGAPSTAVWPPRGQHLEVTLTLQDTEDQLPGVYHHLEVHLHYELYDGLPLLSKWLTLHNVGPDPTGLLTVHSIEELQLNLEFAPVSLQGRGWLQVQSEVPHGQNISWLREEPAVPGGKQPYLLAGYQSPPPLHLSAGAEFVSFKVLELVVPSDCQERRGLARRRMTRVLAPWVLENPVFFHMVNSSTVAVRELIDQMAEVGFEMMIYSFGSGFDLESSDLTYLNQVRDTVDYARSRGIEVGGYDLIALTRKVRQDWMAVNDQTNGSWPSACLASGWYDLLLNRTLTFLDYTGLSMVETDGPYGGYSCSSTSHRHHRGLEDSVYQQDRLQGELYRRLRNRGVYINQPDTYFLQGGSKSGMGYDESQYSLPRWEDLSISRQTVYDNTFSKTPSQGWMFLPLTAYHSPDPAALFEPLADHLTEYKFGLAQYLSAGVAACYRGFRLFDSPTSRAVVKTWVTFYKKYRDVLNGDIIHVRRPTMQDLDGFLHVNPQGEVRGLLVVFNPTEERRSKTLSVPLYYTGITKTARVSEPSDDTRYSHRILSRDYKVNIKVDLDPSSLQYFIIK